MKYCTIKRPEPVKVIGLETNPLSADCAKAIGLGDQIRMASQYQIDIGAPVVVQYDDPATDHVDALTSPDHDFFDLASMVNGSSTPTAGTNVVKPIVETEDQSE